jgi:hypothetical protein
MSTNKRTGNYKRVDIVKLEEVDAKCRLPVLEAWMFTEKVDKGYVGHVGIPYPLPLRETTPVKETAKEAWAASCATLYLKLQDEEYGIELNVSNSKVADQVIESLAFCPFVIIAIMESRYVKKYWTSLAGRRTLWEDFFFPRILGSVKRQADLHITKATWKKLDELGCLYPTKPGLASPKTWDDYE